MIDVHDALSALPWLVDVPTDQRRQLIDAASVHRLERGAEPPEESRGAVSFAVDGALKLVQRDEGGRETILQIYAGGEIIDGASIWSGESPRHNVVALVDGAQLLSIRRHALLEATTSSAPLAHALLKEVAQSSNNLRDRVADMALSPVPRRIARVLSRLATRFGLESSDGSVHVDLSLSRQDVADMCGTTVETAIRVMSRLQAAGILRKARHGIHILDLKALEAMGAGSTALRAR